MEKHLKKSPLVYVILGRYGDLISCLPAFKQIHERTGELPLVMVSTDFAGVFDGVSYVQAWSVPLKWDTEMKLAREIAAKEFDKVVAPQWWHDEQLFDEVDVATGNPYMTVRALGRDLRVDFSRWPNYQHSMWERLGTNSVEMLAAPVVFDQRNPQRENRLAWDTLFGKKPFILYNFTGTSSPFPWTTEMFSVMRKFNDQATFVDLGAVRAERIYDLLGLMERAIGMLTIDTSTLHLAAACSIPYIGITKEGWSGSVCKGNCAAYCTYPDVPPALKTIESIIRTWLLKAPNVKPANPHNPPSILEQTPWPCRFIDCQKAAGDPNSDYFNPSLAEVGGRTILFARRSYIPVDHKTAFNEIAIFDISGGNVMPLQIFQPISQFKGEHLEDPRVFSYNGKLWMSCCNFVWGSHGQSTYTHQVLFELDQQFHCLRRFDIPYIGNGNSLAANTRSEKNWLWFFHEGEPCLIYACQPQLMTWFSAGFKERKGESLSTVEYGWPFGEIRGGPPPVRIGDEYWSFFHSSQHDPEIMQRRYHMGVYAFSARHPHKPTRISTAPILSGSHQDRFKKRGPAVVFPCGALLRNGKWTVSLGVNDLDCAIIEIPHEELIPTTKNL